jgi:hypothetical protein
MDSLYQQILSKLDGPLDPQKFEDCMADVLRDIFPGLVPVRGGKDSGMDGAIADGEGAPFPLICTTSKDVSRNLSRSLDSFLKRGSKAWKVVLATSRALTPQQRFKIEDLAQSKGFVLVQLIEQRGVADRLYHDRRWRTELLELSDPPSALSPVPRTRRPLIEIDPIGRDADLEWLKTTEGDRVLSGAPGSGKTFLLYHLVREEAWNAAFLTEANPRDVERAIQDQQPRVVIVDDAHVDLSVLEILVHLRRKLSVSFEIVAATWEGSRERVVDALGISETKVNNLRPLTRAEILELFRRLGVQENDDIMRLLVDQAANKPGLAVTIATLWLQGAWKEVIEGAALRRSVVSSLHRLLGEESADVLAAFSLGGDRGIRMEVVREHLKWDRPRIRRITAGLAAGGALSEVRGDVLAVWPRPLRIAMVRSVFLTPPGTELREIRELLDKTESFDHAVEVLMEAAHGSALSFRDFQELVFRSRSPRVWQALARMGEEAALWVLESYPDNLVHVVQPILEIAPCPAISKLLAKATEVSTRGFLRSKHPLGVLSSWVRNIKVGPKEGVRRRHILARQARKFLREGGDRDVGIHAACLALSPSVRGDSIDPGRGDTVTLFSGLLPFANLREIEPIWEEVRDTLGEIDRIAWQHLSNTLWDWLHPRYSARGGSVSEEQRRVMRAFSERILRDLSLNTEDSPGLQAGLRRMAAKIGIDLGRQPDPLFELLYPLRDSSSAARREEDISSLAEEWGRSKASEIAARIAFYEKEAQRIGHNGIQNTPDLCRALAENIEHPDVWLSEFLRHNLRSHLTSPVLERMVELRTEGWEQQLKNSLEVDSLSWSALSLVLSLGDPPPDVLARALDKAMELATCVETVCLRNEVPTSTLKLLLSSPDWKTALAAAVGEWGADPQGTVREEVRPDWRAAILRAKTEEYDDAKETEGLQYWLGEILSAEAPLAFDWLLARLGDPDLPWFLEDDSAFARAVRALLREQKLQLLEELKPVPALQSLLPALIENDADLYRKLLARPELADYHLDPLSGMPDEAWVPLALAALDAGYEPSQVADAADSAGHLWSGTGVEYWRRWDDAFASLEGHPDDGLREIAREGRRWVRSRLADAEAEEKRVALHGLAAG